MTLISHNLQTLVPNRKISMPSNVYSIADFKFIVVRVACPICEKFFEDEDRLRSHQLKVHVQNRLMDSDVCKKPFEMKKSSLKRMKSSRLRRNFESKPLNPLKSWRCFQCGKQYVHKASLSKHIRVECGKDPTYQCPASPRVTVKNIENLGYKRRPKILKCDRCGRCYQLQTSLKRHQKLECGIEPKLSCPICGKKFTHKHNLTNHLPSCRRKRIDAISHVVYPRMEENLRRS
ncbi:zinc finger protein 41-like [Hylaeus anthracinus]|uniref:zinc finger protein 41-like n=1 Tax=Hylaeus anthracinus TaxID=313031 RepID=UPI0023B90646|nr:zinc finger protein 41-like [Hylaeus anthracinus]